MIESHTTCSATNLLTYGSSNIIWEYSEIVDRIVHYLSCMARQPWINPSAVQWLSSKMTNSPQGLHTTFVCNELKHMLTSNVQDNTTHISINHTLKVVRPDTARQTTHSNHVISNMCMDNLICNTTMCRNAINFLYNPGHTTLWCLKVVPVFYARVVRLICQVP